MSNHAINPHARAITDYLREIETDLTREAIGERTRLPHLQARKRLVDDLVRTTLGARIGTRGDLDARAYKVASAINGAMPNGWPVSHTEVRYSIIRVERARDEEAS